jgi:hypothetical protein
MRKLTAKASISQPLWMICVGIHLASPILICYLKHLRKCECVRDLAFLLHLFGKDPLMPSLNGHPSTMTNFLHQQERNDTTILRFTFFDHTPVQELKKNSY